jgi:hypothetical protein
MNAFAFSQTGGLALLTGLLGWHSTLELFKASG